MVVLAPDGAVGSVGTAFVVVNTTAVLVLGETGLMSSVENDMVTVLAVEVEGASGSEVVIVLMVVKETEGVSRVVSVLAAVLELELVVDVEVDFVLLGDTAGPFWTWNQFAETGLPKPAAEANPAMSNPSLADESAGGKNAENEEGILKPSGWKYSRRLYLCGPSPSGGEGGR